MMCLNTVGKYGKVRAVEKMIDYKEICNDNNFLWNLSIN